LPLLLLGHEGVGARCLLPAWAESTENPAKSLCLQRTLCYKVAMSNNSERMPRPVLAALLPFARVGLVGLVALATMAVFAGLGQPSGIAAAASVSSLTLLPVNVLTLLVLRRIVHGEGTTLRAMIGFERARLGTDVLWGLLWIMVLYLPFAGAIVGTMFAL